MRIYTILLLAYTAAMLALHLVTTLALRRVSARTLLRFEAIYYAALLGYVAAGGRALLWPAVILGAIHLAGWVISETRPAYVHHVASARVATAVQIFDWAEAVVLIYIGWRLVG